MRIVFAGGGTGGHFFPILAVAREARRIADQERILDLSLYYLGPDAYRPEDLKPDQIVFVPVRTGKLRRYRSMENFFDFFRTVAGILRALWVMFLIMPDVVFSKGGYGSFPTLVAARLYRIPVLIHESDALPGRVNRWAGAFATRVAVAFPEAAAYFPKDRTVLTGIPIRNRILGGTPDSARESLGVFSNRPVLLVTGGSQGAARINHAVVQILAKLMEEYEVIHQTGVATFEDVRLETRSVLDGREPYYHLAPFFDEEKLRSAYVLADLVVSRAGAGAIFELAARAKPSILIPLGHAAQDHQRANAYAYANTGAAAVIDEENLTPSVLLNEIRKLMSDRDARTAMAESARRFARLDAAENIARDILAIGLH